MNTTNLEKKESKSKLKFKEESSEQKKWYQQISFSSFVFATITAIVILLGLAIVFGGINNLRPTQIAEGVEELRLETANGTVILQYKLYDLDGKKILMILRSENADSLSLSNLVNSIVYSKGLSLLDVEVVLKDLDENTTLSPEEYFTQLENEVDPLNPFFESESDTFYEGEETIEPIDFRLYIRATNYSDGRFTVVQLDENTFRIELKEDYTEALFRSEFLSKFLNTEGITFIFVDKNDIRMENP